MKCGVAGNQAEGALEEGFAGFHAVPGGGTGGMRQGNDVEFSAVASGGKFLADDGVQFCQRNELLDGEAADGDDELRLEDFDFAAEPVGAVLNFGGRGHAVAAGGFFAGKTAADGGHVNFGAKGCFGHPGGFVKPAKERAAGGPGEGAAEDGLAVAGRLADEQDFADDRTAADDGRVHLRAQAAGAKLLDVRGEQAGGGIY